MKRIIYLFLVFALPAGAQTFFPMKKGAVLEYKYVNTKGKQLRNAWSKDRFLRLTVDELWGDSVANVSIENEALERALDVKELNPAVADINYGDVYVGSDHVTFENVQWIVSTPPFFEDYWGLGEVYETFRAQISATSCLPRELHVGDTLPDENYRALYIEEPTELGEDPSEKRYREYIKERGITLPENDNREVKAVIRNRHVEAQERVKVPAGEWECWKISYEVVGPIEKIVGYPTREQFEAAGIYRYQRPGDEMPVTTKYIDYISPEVGLVKRDKFNFRGKRVEESLVLESLK